MGNLGNSEIQLQAPASQEALKMAKVDLVKLRALLEDVETSECSEGDVEVCVCLCACFSLSLARSP